MKLFAPSAAALILLLTTAQSSATQENTPEPFVPVPPSQARPEHDVMPPQPAMAQSMTSENAPQPAAGPIAPAGAQPTGALSGRVIFMSGGHGWQHSSSTWGLDRPLLLEMNEDMGNVDQMAFLAYYCFNAGATVVPFRPVGNQTNEVVLDNDDAGVTWWGTWANSGSSVYYGSVGDVPYRFCDSQTNETATATYTPNLPQRGHYPVYCWALGGSNRTNQLYKINHTGGQSLVRVPHRLVGGGWVYLGTYFFEAGSNANSGAVIISNLSEGTNAVGSIIADAIRFGNGMGDVDNGGGISTYPREDEGNRYWVQRSVGQGRSSSIYSGNTSSPIRMAAEMNNEGVDNIYKRAYVGFHSNATTGNPDTATARGVVGLYNNESLFPGTATPNQQDYALKLATEVNSDLVALSSLLETPWYNRTAGLTYARTDYAFGELNDASIGGEFDATIVEVAFHDNVSDALLLRDAKVRNWVARSVYQGLVKYMNAYDGAPQVFLPEPPWNVRAQSVTGGIRVLWEPPSAQAGSGAPTQYVLYQSLDGYGFGQPLVLNTSTSYTVTNVTPGVDYYFRVAARNAGGESMPSETVGCRVAEYPLASKILVVNGFSRFDRTLNLRQNLAAENYKPPGHDRNTGAIERVWPRRINSFDYVVQHGEAITASSKMGFDSCQARSVTNGAVSLAGYNIVVWHAGNQTTNTRTFNSAAQSRISTFRSAGGHLFVSGSDVAFDLGRSTASLSDRQFLTNHLFGVLGVDTNDNSGVWTFTASASSIFSGNAGGQFDDGSKGLYWVKSPDALLPAPGATTAMTYPGLSGRAAAIRYNGSLGGGKVVFWGFPFETITSSALRNDYMADILKDFSRTPAITSIQATNNVITVKGTGEPGLSYELVSSTNLSTWAVVTSALASDGNFSMSDSMGSSARKFYRVRRL